MNASPVEIAWAAGIFEGEGSIVPTHRKSIRLQLHMTDQDIVRRFAALVNAGQVYSLERGSHKTIYYWTCGQHKAVVAFMDAVWPWLGARRRARWTELLELYAATREEAVEARVCVGCGETFAPQASRQARRQKWCSHHCRDRNRVRLGLR